MLNLGKVARWRAGRAARLGLILFLAIGLRFASASAATLKVAPGTKFAKPCQAIAAARPGDTVEIDARGNGTYDGDVCYWSTDRLTIRGVNGRAHIDAAGRNARGKAIWVVGGDDTVIDNVELSGARVPDQNGAAIRQEGHNLTLRRCYFHDNEMGILAGDKPGSSMLIEFSEFANNGTPDGRSHNIYVNHIDRFTLRFSYSHHARSGHLVKSRAAENYVLYNRLSDEATGTASYELEFPNGGKSYVIGNVIEQGPESENSTILAYMREGLHPRNPSHELFVVNNTFVNDRPKGGTFLGIAAGAAPVLVKNNIFYGRGTVITQKSALLSNNLVGKDPKFVDAAHYDYHLRRGSPAVDAGADPGKGAGVPLTPRCQYVHPASGEERKTVGRIDIGAFELGGGGRLLAPDERPRSERLAPPSICGN